MKTEVIPTICGYNDTQRLGRLGVIRVRRPFKYILFCGLGILGDKIVFVMRVMEL